MPILNQTTLNTLSIPSLPKLDFVEVAPGSFIMCDDNSRLDREKPAHPVEIKKSFYLCKYQVTQALYKKVMEENYPELKNSSRFKGNSRPVEQVSWNDTKLFLAELENSKEIEDFKSDHPKFANFSFRLPSEAEWEFAACGGIHSQDYEYAGSDDLKQVGWYDENSGDETKPVGLLLPNELGLYDMSGNVWEWCEDDFHNNAKLNEKDRPLDGSAWIDGVRKEERAVLRVLRGGGYFNNADDCRPAFRNNSGRPDSRLNFTGFRLIFSL